MRSCSCSLSTIACGAVYEPWPLRPGSGLACRPNRARRNSLRPEGCPWATPLRRAASGHGCIAMLRLGCRAVCTALAPEAPARCSARSSRVGRPREPGAASRAASPRRRAASSEAPWSGCCGCRTPEGAWPGACPRARPRPARSASGARRAWARRRTTTTPALSAAGCACACGKRCKCEHWVTDAPKRPPLALSVPLLEAGACPPVPVPPWHYR